MTFSQKELEILAKAIEFRFIHLGDVLATVESPIVREMIESDRNQLRGIFDKLTAEMQKKRAA